MRIAIVNSKSFMISGYRIDPDIHLSEGVQVRRELHALPYELSTIGENAKKIFCGNIFSRTYVTKPSHGTPYLAASDTVLANFDTGKYLSRKQAEKLSYLKIERDWILVTCSGTLGNVTYTNRIFEKYIATHDLIRIIPNDLKVNKGVLYAFLAGKFGYYQITQSQFGGVVKHINEEQISKIIVPIFPLGIQNTIGSLIEESSRLREEAADAIDEAKKYFDTLYPIVTENTKYFTKRLKCLNFSFAAYNNNIETENFKNLYLHNSFKIKEQTSKVFAPPLFKHIYLSKDNGYPFMTGGELSKSNMRYYRWLSPRGVGDIKDYVVDEGTLLLYKSGSLDGMIGSVFIVDNTIDKCCLSDHVIRVVFNDKRLGYWTFAFLKSKGGVKMLKALATGAAIPFITPERLCELSIPNPDENYEKIVSLVEKHINCISLSKIKENQAITMVEEEIEKWNK